MDTSIKIALLIISYLIGSIPFGFLIGKIKGIDIREHGSKNIGSTNIGRVLGRKYAILTFILDTIKGAIIVALFRYQILPQEYILVTPLFYGFTAVLGHTFPIYLKFKGGKAVATSGGVILAYSPTIFLVSVTIFLIVTHFTKFVSLGSIIAASSVFIFSLIAYILKNDIIFKLLKYDIWFPIMCLIMFLIIVLRHKTNIRRLIKKIESKVRW